GPRIKRNRAGGRVLSSQVFGGKSSQYRYRILDRWAAHPSRYAGAIAEKAVPFPGAVRRSELVFGSLRSTHFAGDRSRVRCRRGNQRVVRLKPIRGAQDGLSTANARDERRGLALIYPRNEDQIAASPPGPLVSLPCGARPASCRPLAKPLCPW